MEEGRKVGVGVEEEGCDIVGGGMIPGGARCIAAGDGKFEEEEEGEYV